MLRTRASIRKYCNGSEYGENDVHAKVCYDDVRLSVLRSVQYIFRPITLGGESICLYRDFNRRTLGRDGQCRVDGGIGRPTE